MDEKIMDVVEETAETMAEPVVEAAEKIDWSKYGLIGSGVALVAAGAFAAYKLVPKGIERGKKWKAEHEARKQEKQDEQYIEVDEYEVIDVKKGETKK